MKVRYEQVPKAKPILRPEGRQHDPEYLKRLAESLARGQLQPIGLLKDFTVIWGAGRVLAARMERKITHLTAAVLEEEVTWEAFLRMQAVENFLRNELSNSARCIISIEYARSNPNLSQKQIAADFGVDASLVTRYMAWEKCIEPVQQALAADKITLTGMYAISQLPQELQAAALASALAAPNAGAVTKAIRQQRNGSSTIKTVRVRCLMSSGVTVTLAREGEGLTLDDVVNVLSELQREARKANEQGLDSKTFSAVLKDKARAG